MFELKGRSSSFSYQSHVVKAYFHHSSSSSLSTLNFWKKNPSYQIQVPKVHSNMSSSSEAGLNANSIINKDNNNIYLDFRANSK